MPDKKKKKVAPIIEMVDIVEEPIEEPIVKRPKISMIAACGKNRAVGKNNKIPWHIPEDFKYFKQATMGKPIIMGRKTFDSIGRLLPGRLNIVITRNPDTFDYRQISDQKRDQVEVTSSLEDALQIAFNDALIKGHGEVFIIGGGQIYKQGMDYAELIYLTEIDVLVHEADAFFPEFSQDEWSLEHSEAHQDNNYFWHFNIYKRKKEALKHLKLGR